MFVVDKEGVSERNLKEKGFLKKKKLFLEPFQIYIKIEGRYRDFSYTHYSHM